MTDFFNRESESKQRYTKQHNGSVDGRMTTRESMIVTAQNITQKLGKVPAGAFDIVNDKERTKQERKTIVFIILDIILLGVLIFSLTSTVVIYSKNS